MSQNQPGFYEHVLLKNIEKLPYLAQNGSLSKKIEKFVIIKSKTHTKKCEKMFTRVVSLYYKIQYFSTIKSAPKTPLFQLLEVA